MRLPFQRPRTARTTRLVAPLVAGLLLAGLGAMPAAASGRSFYMSPTGSDAAAGTVRSPWKSIYASLRKLRAGDTLYIRGGSYSFSGTHYTGVRGTSTAPIVVRNYPGETPVFTGTSTPANFLYFDGAAYVTLRGLVVQGGGATTVGSSLLGFEGTTHHIRIEKVRLRGASSWTLNQHLAYIGEGSVREITFKYSTFDGRGCICAGLLHLYHDPNATGVKVYANTFRNADQAVMIWANVSGLKIWDNRFDTTRIAVRHHNSRGTTVTGNTGTRVSIGVYADSRRSLTVSGNDW